MNKEMFFDQLKERLKGIPQKELQQAMDYYNELIEDKIEEGIMEEEAIDSLGEIDSIVNEILSSVSIPKLVKEKFSPKRKLKNWEIVLLTLTSIIWLPLLFVATVVVLVGYICLWSGVISLGAVALYSLVNSYLVVMGLIDAFSGNVGSGFVLIGFGLFFIGMAIILGLLTYNLAKIMFKVCKKLILKIKSLFIRRREKYEK